METRERAVENTMRAEYISRERDQGTRKGDEIEKFNLA